MRGKSFAEISKIYKNFDKQYIINDLSVVPA